MSETNEDQKVIDCPHCGKAISATLKTCPYCKKAIEFQPEQPKENDNGLKKYNIKKILLVAYIVISVFVIFVLCNYSSSLETRNGELREEVSSYEDEFDDWESENKDLKKKLAEIEDYKAKYNELNAQIDNYKDQQSTIDSLNGQVTDLQNQVNTLQQQVSSLQSENASLKASAVSSSSSSSGVSAQSNDTSTDVGETVYWTAGGDCYHSTPNCATLKRSSNIMSGSVSSAGGRRPCKVCH